MSARTTPKKPPKWLAEKIAESRRAAKREPCPRCGQDTYYGPDDDHDRPHTISRYDTQPVDELTEITAWLEHQVAADVDHRRSGETWLWNRMPNDDRHKHDVVLRHLCNGPTQETNTDPWSLFQ